MYKILLIDDEANNGWKEILEKVLFKDHSIDVTLDVSVASEFLDKIKYDIIFLDLRFGQQDHSEKNVKNFTGYKILSENIRKSFDSLNFSTSVILFTASNKIWNVFEMLDNGADSYYIKEHPDTSNDLEFSRRNFIRLKNNVPELIRLSQNRDEILQKANKIIILSKNSISNSNIRDRIEEKLKIGYATLFRGISQFEKDKLLFDNELMAFIAFWSVLEEIVKDSFVDNWIKTGDDEGYMRNGDWILRNGEHFVDNLIVENRGTQIGFLRVGIQFKSGKYEKNIVDLKPGNKDISFYQGRI